MKKKKVGIMSELLIMIVVPMLLLEVIITSLSINAMSSMVKRQALDGLHLLCTSVYAAYEAKDSGDLILDGERLFKGSYCISEQQNVVDTFVEGSDADVTLLEIPDVLLHCEILTQDQESSARKLPTK